MVLTLYQRLQEQSVACSCQRYLGVIHGFFQLGGVSQVARNAMRDVAACCNTRIKRERDRMKNRDLPLLLFVPAFFVGTKRLCR